MPRVAPATRPRAAAVATGVLAALLLTACGSTVQVSSEAAAGAGAGLGPVTQEGLVGGGAPGATTGGATPGGGAGPSGTTGSAAAPAGGAPGTTGSTTGQGAGARGGGGSTGATAAALPPKGFGWDEKNVYFGVVTQDDAQQAFAAFGADNVDPGNTLAQVQAVADHVNARGGVLGRKVVIRRIDVPTVETATNPEQKGAQVCTYFTQDAPVIGVLSVVTVMDYPNFRTCLAKKGVTLWSSTLKLADDQALADLSPSFVQTVMVSWTRLAPVLVQRLKALGWFSGWNVRTGAPGSAPVKVGILTDSTKEGRRTAELLKSEVARAGFPGAVDFNYGQASDGQSESVQYFQQNGVTHVIVTDVELLAFQVSAQSQAYKPRFGITSYNAPFTNLEESGLSPGGANNGAMGVGWAPALDVSEANDPKATPGTPTCRKIMAAADQNLSGKRLAQAIAFSACDALLLTQLGAQAGGGFAGPALARGLEARAPSYASATSFRTALSGGRRFVPGAARDLAFDAECSCVRYGSATVAL